MLRNTIWSTSWTLSGIMRVMFCTMRMKECHYCPLLFNIQIMCIPCWVQNKEVMLHTDDGQWRMLTEAVLMFLAGSDPLFLQLSLSLSSFTYLVPFLPVKLQPGHAYNWISRFTHSRSPFILCSASLFRPHFLWLPFSISFLKALLMCCPTLSFRAPRVSRFSLAFEKKNTWRQMQEDGETKI